MSSFTAAHNFFSSQQSKMKEFICHHEEIFTVIGQPNTWPSALRVLLNLILNSSYPMLIAWGSKLICFFNDAYCMHFGDQAQAALGKPFAELWPNSGASLNLIVNEVLAGKTINYEDLPLIIQRNGQDLLTYFNFSCSPLYDENDEIMGLLCLAMETTKKVKTESALHTLRTTFDDQLMARTAQCNRIWTLSQEIMGMSDFEGNIKAFNPAWKKVLGYEDEHLQFESLFNLIHADDTNIFHAAVDHMRVGQDIKQLQTRLRSCNGFYRWIDWTTVAEGKYFYLIGRDITAEKIALDELENTQAALRQSQKMETVGQLTSGIAHDFNNLLQGIASSLNLLQIRITEGQIYEAERLIAVGLDSTQRANALIHRLLAFSRRQALDPQHVEINELIQNINELLKRTLGHVFEVELTLLCGACEVLCDVSQCENALLNLVINARDAMPNGGKLIIKTQQLEAKHPISKTLGKYICISVIDTGTGMSAEVRARAFDPFFTTKPLGEGTGLGLSMIYGFAQQSKGFVDIQSELGVGTTVNIYLPCIQNKKFLNHDESMQRSQSSLTSSKIALMVESDQQTRRLVLETLNSLGYKVLLANDAITGLSLLKTMTHIDLLITNTHSSNFDNTQIARAARMLESHLKILFLIRESKETRNLRREFKKGICTLLKPFTTEALSKSIMEFGTEKG